MSEENREERTPLTGKKEAVRATQCSRLQAPLQCYLRPAVWIPGLNRLHSHRETWRSEETGAQHNIDAVQRALVKVIENDKSHSDFVVSKVEDDFLQIQVFTRAEWLDVIEMKFEGNQIKIFAFSSGSCHCFLPGACLVNVMFFWVPFLDMGMNKKRLRWILSQMDVAVEQCSS